MEPNLQCNLCGSLIYRNYSQIKQSKSGLFFCSYACKSMHAGGSMYHTIPHDNKIFDAALKAWKIIPLNKMEYLTHISLYKPSDVNAASPHITANARVNGIPNLCGKTPDIMEKIRNCFFGITMKDVLLLPLLEDDINWKYLDLRCWNDNDITYEIW